MRRAWKKIERMIAENWTHRRGFRLKEVLPPFILSQARDEFDELAEDLDSPEEMADLIGVLIHYSLKQGWTMELIEKLLIEKLNLRFKKAGQP